MPVDQPESHPDNAPRSISNPDISETRHVPPGAFPTDSLFQGRQEILIDHNGERYRLRITRNDKLILTK
jgi:hemin uptake protein HemP